MDSDGLQPPSDLETLARILNRTASLLQAKVCGVFMWDRERNVLSPMKPFAGVDESKTRGLELPVGGTAMGTALLQDRPMLLTPGEDNPDDAEILKTLGVQNGVAVPLAIERRDENNEVVERSIMGAYCAFDKFYGRSFDMEDARLLSMMARQASAVLVTSHHFWKEVERTKRIGAIIESTSVGLMAVSPKGTVTQVNAAARRALGVNEQGWFGRHYEDLITNHEICILIADAMSGNPPEEPREINLNVINPGGEEEERIYRIQVDQIRSEEGQSMGWVTVFENITDIRAAERMMAAFVDMVSHELRTPLTPIRGFVSTLLQAGEGMFDWETQEEFLQIVDTEAERLGVLIDDFLNIARIQNGRTLQFSYSPTNVSNVFEHVCRLHRQISYMKAEHTLVTEVLPGAEEIMSDQDKLQQILHNLVANALKYSPNGGEVRLSARPDGEGVVVSIKDQGLGIPPDQIPKMFGQFFRVESSSHTGIKGTGLGLWLTKHMIEGHKGRVWVESDWGKGSNFLIWLPRDPNNYTPPPADSNGNAPASGS